MSQEQSHHQKSSRNGPGFGKKILKDLTDKEIHRTIHRDLKDLYGFYLDEDRRNRLTEMNWFMRTISVLAWLLKSLYFKLPPSRRILLIISFGCVLAGKFDFQMGTLILDLPLQHIGFVIILLILMLELMDKLLARDELKVGRSIQLALLPDKNPDLEGWDIWLYTRPANDVGGDLVDYMSLGPDRLAVALGDVTGKGLGAALLMAKLQATLRALATDSDSLVDLGTRTNQIFCRDGVRGRVATLAYVELSPGSGEIRLLNAGHIPPIIMRGTELEILPPMAMPLGILPDTVYSEQRIILNPGDMFVIYSDGVTEACNEAGEFYDEPRLLKLLPQMHGLSVEAAAEHLLADVNKFVGDARHHDDLSLAILKRRT